MEKNIKKEYIYICITESLCCTAEINTTLWINYTSITKKEKKRKQPHYNCIKKNKIPRYKLTKEVKDLYTENYNTLKKTQKNEKTVCAHGLEELILLKCPYYPKQSTDSMQCLSKFQWHFSQK